MSARNEADVRMRRELDERRTDGAKAWSPSAAREWLRRIGYGFFDVERRACDGLLWPNGRTRQGDIFRGLLIEAEDGAVLTPEAFDRFCDAFGLRRMGDA